MIFRAGIEIGLAAFLRRHDALIFELQFPPGFVVIRRLDLSRENFPAPLIDQKPERQKCHFIERVLHQECDIAGIARHLLEQSNFVQIVRGNRKRDGVADGFVESVIRAILKKRRKLVISALIKIVPQLVMNGGEILVR